MRFQLLLILMFSAVFFACNQQKEEMLPIQPELGKYQLELKGNTFDLIHTIELKHSGNVLGWGIIKNAGDSKDLGYSYYFSGVYTLEDGVVSIFQESYFQVGEAGKQYDSKEMLVLVQTRSASSDYSIKSNYTELHFICPPNSICLQDRVFKRVD
ncbi:hypothetical protein JYB62_03115 [Algoriphagus lutimaris]|uniref:hypothetical protein n=1 Tax=Algoriphagus lutimaris TaxID=613197 RepID=UPI00196A228D|nr:hypothetical protein [Algoriphagus lutimaris]MBN3518980.1 hypothetical protein [Algoriphagus lutimaris]